MARRALMAEEAEFLTSLSRQIDKHGMVPPAFFDYYADEGTFGDDPASIAASLIADLVSGDIGGTKTL